MAFVLAICAPRVCLNWSIDHRRILVSLCALCRCSLGVSLRAENPEVYQPADDVSHHVVALQSVPELRSEDGRRGQVHRREGPEQRDEDENNLLQRSEDSESGLLFAQRVSTEPISVSILNSQIT